MKQSLLKSQNSQKPETISKANIHQGHAFSFLVGGQPKTTGQSDVKGSPSVLETSRQRLQFPHIFDRYGGRKAMKEQYSLRVNLSIQFTSSNIIGKNNQNSNKSKSVFLLRSQAKERLKAYKYHPSLQIQTKYTQVTSQDKSKQRTKGHHNNRTEAYPQENSDTNNLNNIFMTSLKSPKNTTNSKTHLKFRNIFYQKANPFVASYQQECAPKQLKNIVKQQLASKMVLRQAQAQRGIMIVNYKERMRYEEKFKMLKRHNI